MIGTLRKHSNWLWGIIIVATIVGMVVYLDPSRMHSSGNYSAQEVALGTLNNEPISVEQYSQAKTEATLFYFLRYGKFNEMERNGFDLESWTYERILLEATLKKSKIEVTDLAAARTAKQILGVPADQALPADNFNQFVRERLLPNHISADDFDRYVRHQAGAQQLISLYGMSGQLITPKEAGYFFQRENEPMETQIASFPLSSYFSKITIAPKDLEQYYGKKAALYRIPEQVQLNYVFFNLTNYLDEADKKIKALTNYSLMVDREYLEKGPKNYVDEKGNVMTADAAKAKIAHDHREAIAREVGTVKAREIINTLYKDRDENYQFTTNDLFKAVAGTGFTVKTTAPFEQRIGPAELKVPRQAIPILFNLTDKGSADQLYPTSPVVTEDGVAVIGFARRIPSQAQPLSVVREKVFADARMDKAMEMARVDGEKFEMAVTTGLAQGKTFEAIASAQNAKVKTLAPYTLTSTNAPVGIERGDFETLQSATFNLPVGKSSGYIPTEDGGMVAYVKNRLPVDQAAIARNFPAYLERMREQRQVAAFDSWLQRQSVELKLVRPQVNKPKASGS